MPAATRRIAVLSHAKSRDYMSGYIVHHLARFWQEDGHDVVYLFGTRTFVPADVVLVHVDLSVTPDSYVEFANRYPLVLNGGRRDIRKSAISANLLHRGDDWSGAVIVKSDLNCGGSAEQSHADVLGHVVPGWRRVRRHARRLSGRVPTAQWNDYSVYDTIDAVPNELFERPDVVVERFLPEREDGLHFLRVYQFLGDRSTCVRMGSPDAVVKASVSVVADAVEPHHEVESLRAELGLDYGKLDYTIHDGRAVVFDVNLTTGASKHMPDDDLNAMRRYLAEGLYSYFD